MAADLQHMLFYSGSLRVLAALSFVDRPVSSLQMYWVEGGLFVLLKCS